MIKEQKFSLSKNLGSNFSRRDKQTDCYNSKRMIIAIILSNLRIKGLLNMSRI